MSDDIVQRLRADYLMQPPPTRLQLEAADAIEALRAQVKALLEVLEREEAKDG